MTTMPQQLLFQAVKAKLPAHLSLVEEVASVLGISTDSTYRRIRGEKPLSLEETLRLCQHYGISLDGLLNLSSGAILFTGQIEPPSDFRFEQYLSSLDGQVAFMNSFQQKKMFYLCKDIPIFHHFHYREIAAFKHYFWMKTILQSPSLNQKKFRFSDYPDELYQLGRKALAHYNQLDSVEIWNMENINSTIRQIEFYHNSGVFEREEDIFLLYEKLDALVAHLQQQAGEGKKFEPGHAPSGGSFEVYYNEVILGDNSILAVLNGQKIAFLVHSGINFMMTRDLRFCDHLHEHLQNLMRRSTLISSVSERERARFFHLLRQRIKTRKQNLKA